MKKALRCILASALALMLILSVLSGCAVKDGEESGPVVDTIYIGHHYIPEIDPTYVDPITGEPGMAPDKLKCASAALATVKEELGVDIKWKQWPGGATRDCLQTVLAGDPFCHMAVLSGSAQATVLTQNVLQPLDPYLEVFNHPDAEWIVMPEVFGNHYFMERDLIYVTDWPMVFNINMIEAVPDLKDENGNTIFPYDLYREGKWTWSNFEEYLGKIQAYYAGKKGARGNDIAPFNTNYIYALQMALHSNGASIYDGSSLGVDTPEAIEAAEHLDSLMQKGLVSCTAASFGSSAANGGTGIDEYFRNSESVFTHMARWRMGGASNVLAERGESMGIIFWPRPDDVPFTDEEYVPGASQYEICKPACDAIGLLRGFDADESLLAVQAYVLYTEELYKNMGRTETIAEYRETMAPSEALTFGIDIFHPGCGEDNLKVFELLGSLPANEFSENMGLMGDYCVNIFGKSVYGVDGSPKYPIAIKSKKAGLLDRIDNIAESLRSTDAVDAVAPSVAQIDQSVPIAFEKGTNPATISWEKIFTSSDNADGTYTIKTSGAPIATMMESFLTVAKAYDDTFDKVDDAVSADIDVTGAAGIVFDAIQPGRVFIKANPAIEEEDGENTEKKIYKFEPEKMIVDYALKVSEETGETVSGVDFDNVGKYENGLAVSVTDIYGNTYSRNFTVYIYDKNNTVEPTLKLKEEMPALEVEVDTSTVDWAGKFVEEAFDVNGVDIKGFVEADVSYLDVTVPGTYDVTIYVEDLAGNKTEQQTKIRVE